MTAPSSAAKVASTYQPISVRAAADISESADRDEPGFRPLQTGGSDVMIGNASAVRSFGSFMTGARLLNLIVATTP